MVMWIIVTAKNFDGDYNPLNMNNQWVIVQVKNIATNRMRPTASENNIWTW